MITTRREMLRTGATALSTGAITHEQGQVEQTAGGRPVYRNYFGDLHNHNQVGYAQGTLGRSFEIARNHLDFYAFTPHAYWPDIGEYDGHIETKWKNGFHVAKANWPEVVEHARRFDNPGRFVTMLGYERHGTAEGDYHILFPDLQGDYELIAPLKDLQAFALRRNCILVPHHPANRLGHRGIAAAHVDPRVSPVMEIYSEWGCAEHDRAPQPYKRHTEGGRWTRNTWQHYLAGGLRFGVIGSTDDHLGYPGAYREGLAAIKASSLTREALFEALRARRTYAVTGDRIDLDFHLNGQIMGQELPYTRQRRIEVAIRGWDEVERVEILKNNRVVHRDFPMDRVPAAGSWKRPVAVRFEYGWGPWPALGWGGTADWDFRLEVEGGRIESMQTCFATGPLDEFRRDQVLSRSGRHIHVKSYTALRQQVDDYSQKAIVMRIEGDPGTRVRAICTKPKPCSLVQTLGQLSESNEMLFTAPFPWESAMLHRLVFADNYETRFTFEDEDSGDSANWYYVRVVQANGDLAWSSPVWVEKR